MVAAAALVVALASPATAGDRTDGHGHGTAPSDYQLTVMGTTDLHGSALNWDYFKNAEYDDSAHNDVGLAKVSTLVNQVRADEGDAQHAPHRRRRHDPGHLARLLLRQDRADLEARRAPDGGRDERDRLRRRRASATTSSTTASRTCARSRSSSTSRCSRRTRSTTAPAGPRSSRTSSRPSSPPHGKPIKVGILGLTNPGIAIWDKANVEGKMHFDGLVEQADAVRARDEAQGRRRRRRRRALGCRHVLVVRRHAAVPGERRDARGAAGARHRRDPRRPRAPGDRRSAS